MTDWQRIALIAGGCSGTAGVIGLVALRLLRGRSLRTKFMMTVVPIILAPAAGVVWTAGAGLVSRHDRAPMIEVCLSVGIVVAELAILFARRVAADVKILRMALHAMGEGGEGAYRESSPRQARSVITELDDLRRELVAAEARLSRSHERERAEERSRRELVTKMTLDLHTPLADLRALTVVLADDAATAPAACYARVLKSVDRLTGMVDDLFELCREPGDHRWRSASSSPAPVAICGPTQAAIGGGANGSETPVAK